MELKADKAHVKFTSPVAAAVCGKRVGESAELPIKLASDGDLMLVCVGVVGVHIRSTLRLGTMDPSKPEATAAIRQAVQRCLAEE